MVQYLELLPAGIGASFYALHHILAARVPLRRSSTKTTGAEESASKAKAKEAGLDATSPPRSPREALQPEAEPGPEPQPEPEEEAAEEASAPATPARQASPKGSVEPRRHRWPAAAAVAAALVLVLVALALRGTAGPDVATSPVMESDLAAPEVSLDVPVVAEAAAAEAAEVSLDVPAVAEAPATEADDGQLIRLKLTRQHMAVQTIGDVMYYKSAYWGTLSVGTPPMPYKVVFDTGSGHLILPSSYCHSETCRAHKRYRRSASTTAKDIDYDGTIVEPGEPRDQITVSFGTGEVTGVFVEDVVCMESGMPMNASFMEDADIEAANRSELALGCVKLRLIAATEMSTEPFKAFKFDGVLGLGLEGLSQAPEFNFVGVVAAAMGRWGGKNLPIFAVFLAENKREESELTLGGWAPEHLDGDLAWTPVLDPAQGHWMVSIKSVWVDGERVRFCDEGCRGVVDTGTSLLAVPTPAFPELFELLRHPAGPTATCRGAGPKLHIELEGNITVTLEPQDYARLENGVGSSALVWPKYGPTGIQEPPKEIFCKPMLMSMDLPAPIGPKLFILGEPILRKYYTVYDVKENRIGFGRAAHGSASAADAAELEESDEWWDEE